MDQCYSNAIAMDRRSATSVPPGFRFQPNGKELSYYLKHKVSGSGKPLDFEPIAEVDVYKSEPWDLPSKSGLKMRGELEWYFFSALGRKYGKSSRVNRTTEKGYWKSTGKDREVRHNSRTVGMMKKVLVFHTGRSPNGVSTNWVMHEYRLVDKDALVLCKIFQKIGTNPKNGGEASIEEEGGEHDDMGVVVPAEEAAAEEVAVGDDGKYVEAEDLGQICITSENTSLSLKFSYLDKNNYLEHSGNFIGDSQQPIIGTGETSNLRHDQMFVDIPEQHGMGAKLFTDKYIAGDELFIEDKDLSTPIEADPSDYEMFDKFLINLDEGFDPSEFFVNENIDSHQTPVTQKNEIGGADKVSTESLHLWKLQGINDASSSKAVMDESEVTSLPNFSELEEIFMKELETPCGHCGDNMLQS